MRIVIAAGEASGDQLAAGLIPYLKSAFPSACIEGIAGEKMIAAGCHPIIHCDELSVMGLFEILKYLPRLWRIRRKFIQHLLQNLPDLYIGVDSSTFNLSIQSIMKQHGVKTVQYASPTVWAWRQYRLKKIKQTVDLMLTLYPFEANFYHQHQMQAKFVGHPLADCLNAEEINIHQLRQSLGLPLNKTLIAILPGSRSTELNYLLDVMLAAAKQCAIAHPEIEFIIPVAKAKFKNHIEEAMHRHQLEEITHLFMGQAHQLLAAADLVLTKSGTSTLEAMLYQKPMVVCYRMSALTWFFAKRLIKTPFIALPNLLAQGKIVPEFIQHEVTPQQLSAAMNYYLTNSQLVHTLQQKYINIINQLRLNADQTAAQAIVELMTT